VAWFPALAPGKILQFHVISPAMVGIFNSDLLFVMVKYLLGYVEIGRGGRDKVVMALLRENRCFGTFSILHSGRYTFYIWTNFKLIS
jgi:hypothetical protein